MDDAAAAAVLFERLGGLPTSTLRRIYADSKYHNTILYPWVEANLLWKSSIVRRPAGEKGWVKLPIRRVVERKFAWLGRSRRLTKDRGKTTSSSDAFIRWSMIDLMLH